MNAINIGNRVEMLADDCLVDSAAGLEFRLNRPVEREVALTIDRPWEDAGSLVYASLFRWEGAFHLYYRATGPGNRNDNDVLQYLCYARSADGVHWEKPSLGLYDYQGSTDNNILMSGGLCHNFTPVPDTNPACPPEARVKAVAGTGHALYLFASADGLRFHRVMEEPVLTMERYGFDSQNVLFYDGARGVYRIYSRYFNQLPGGEGMGVRAIQSCASPDCAHWSAVTPNVYNCGADEHLYTNATVPCPGAEHMLLSFPMRFSEKRSCHLTRLSPGVSDAVFMSSRDGVHWDRRHMDSFVDGGADERSWTQRCNMPARGLLETGDEFSLYVTKRYCWDDVRLVRYTVRRFRFSALRAGAEGGELRTKPIAFDGGELRLNFASAATGSLRVGLADPETGRFHPGFAPEDCAELYGDMLDEPARFAGGSLAAFAGRPVVLVARLRLCSLYAFRFARCQ